MEESDEDVQDVTTIFNLKQIEVLPVDAEQLSKETRKILNFPKSFSIFNKDGQVRGRQLYSPITVGKVS